MNCLQKAYKALCGKLDKTLESWIRFVENVGVTPIKFFTVGFNFGN